MKNNKGFNLVDVMIVVVIIGLLAAMAIPAFQKVHEESLLKAYRSGKQLSPDEMRIIAKRIANDQAAPAPVVGMSTVTVNGVVYYLYPKNTTFEEIRLSGHDYILVPAR